MDGSELEFLESNNIVYQNVIAHGGFGTIYLVFSLQYQQFFALKKIPENRFNKAEIDCLMEIVHPNIISLYKYYTFNYHIYLLMEYCPYDLYNLLKREQSICDEQLKRYCYDILQGIKACHDRNISHSDIKPSNFLIDKYGRIKVCDFGLSVMSYDCNSCQIFRGTMYYMAPEILLQKSYNAIKADIWALGVTFYYLSTQTYPFFGNNRKELIKEVTTGLLPIFKVHNSGLRQVITACLQMDPNNRPSVDELLELPYFESIRANIARRGNIRMANSQNQLNIRQPVLLCKSGNGRYERASLNSISRIILKPKIVEQK